MQSRAQSEEAARLLPGIYQVRPHQRVGAIHSRAVGMPPAMLSSAVDLSRDRSRRTRKAAPTRRWGRIRFQQDGRPEAGRCP